MAKILQGKVVSNKMQNTAVVEVIRTSPHPLYRKLLKRSKKFKVETKGATLTIGQIVKIVETKPVSKDKHFALLEVESAVETVKETSDKPAFAKSSGEAKQKVTRVSRVKRGGQIKKEKKA